MSFEPIYRQASANDELPVCFVVMPFSDPTGYPKGYFLGIYEDIFVPAIINAGYRPVRCDEIYNGKSIPTNMFEHLDNDPMVLCDLSSFNPNVLYELGRRHFQNKPAVLVQEEGQTYEGKPYIFDLQAQGFQIIPYRKDFKYREVLQDQNKITNALRSTAPFSNKHASTGYVDAQEFHSLRTEYYKNWPFKKTRSEYQIEPPSETALSSFARNYLSQLVVQAPEIRQRISRFHDGETLQYAKRMLTELNDAMRNFWPYLSNDDDHDLYGDAERLKRQLTNYIITSHD